MGFFCVPQFITILKNAKAQLINLLSFSSSMGSPRICYCANELYYLCVMFLKKIVKTEKMTNK